MKLKQKSYLIGLACLCIAVYQSYATPLLQCVSKLPEWGVDMNNLTAYVVESTKNGVYGQWYTIHDYDSTPKRGKRELIKGSNIGNVTSIVTLKDVGDESTPIKERMTLRSLYYIAGSIFSKEPTAAFSSLDPPQFKLKNKFKKFVAYIGGGTNLYLSVWVFSGLDYKGEKVKELKLYCDDSNSPFTKNFIEKSFLDSYFNNSLINITEIPKDFIDSESKAASNIASFRLSQQAGTLSPRNISTLYTIEWKIISEKDNKYDIAYRFRNEKDWTQTTATITAIDPEYPENAHELDNGSQLYYEFYVPIPATINNTNSGTYILVTANIWKSKNNISYHNIVDGQEVKTNTKIIDSGYLITHKRALEQKPKEVKPAEQGKYEEKSPEGKSDQ